MQKPLRDIVIGFTCCGATSCYKGVLPHIVYNSLVWLGWWQLAAVHVRLCQLEQWRRFDILQNKSNKNKWDKVTAPRKDLL